MLQNLMNCHSIGKCSVILIVPSEDSKQQHSLGWCGCCNMGGIRDGTGGPDPLLGKPEVAIGFKLFLKGGRYDI